jgi:hypothetical protein
MGIIRFHTATDLSPNQRTITVAITPENSTEIDFRDFAGGSFGVDENAGGSAYAIWYHVASKPGGTFRMLCDEDNIPIAHLISPNRSYALPEELYGFGAFKLVTANEPILATVSLKG